MVTRLLFRLYWAWLHARPGQGIVEYGLIIILVAIAVMVLLGLLGGQIGSLFNRITGSIAAA
jgi:Flp pilus assembly pilin Flp